MIVQDIYLRDPDWEVRVYYAVDQYYADDILDDLIAIGCRGKMLKDAEKNLWAGKLDTGLTYANPSEKKAVMVIGKTSSGAEFDNSRIHELLHLLAYISEAEHISPYGERICYIGGDIVCQMHKVASELSCDGCREEVIHFLTPR